MEFMDFHIVDIIIVSLVLFLAIKGLVNGFSKELFNFITIVGGVAIAARFNTAVVDLINTQKVVPTINESYAKIIGFVVIILAIWIIIGLISSIISKLSSEQPSIISRILGYIFSATRYLFIFSLIVFGVNQSEFFKNEATKLKAETQLFIPMTKVGAKLLNMESNTTLSSNTQKAETNSSIELIKQNKTKITEVQTTQKTTLVVDQNNSY